MALIDKIKKARETQVVVDGFTLTIRRPTDLELHDLKSTSASSLIHAFVVGWHGVNEVDLIPGGSPILVDFDADVLVEWAANKKIRWQSITNEIWRVYADYKASVGENLGKPEAG